nr:MAG TPA: hypothetical protein [Caudoviricetes sp.]
MFLLLSSKYFLYLSCYISRTYAGIGFFVL